MYEKLPDPFPARQAVKRFTCSMMPDVYFYEVFAEEEESLRRHLSPTHRVVFSRDTIQEAGHDAPPCPVISIRTQSKVPAAWAPQLRAILSRSAGFDHLDRFRSQAGTTVQLGHLYRYSGRAVAEQAALLWMALLRKLPAQTGATPAFHRDNLTGRECLGRTLSVFGVGDIGHQVVQVARGLGMQVLGVDPEQRHPDVHYVSPEEALAASDVLVVAMNLNAGNDNYFDEARLSLCRPDTVFVNVARGEFARSTLLLRMLETGRLGGVGLDVYRDEPVIASALRTGTAVDNEEFLAVLKLFKRTDAILTPHNAFNTHEAVDRKSIQTARQLETFFRDGAFADQPTET